MMTGNSCAAERAPHCTASYGGGDIQISAGPYWLLEFLNTITSSNRCSSVHLVLADIPMRMVHEGSDVFVRPCF